jgi:hypothetical protein
MMINLSCPGKIKFFPIVLFIAILFLPILVSAGGGGGSEGNNSPAPTTTNPITVIPNPIKCEDVECLVQTIADMIAGLVTVIGTIMIIIGGIQYIASAGNEDRARRAKNTVLYAIIGIAIAVSVDFIIGFLREILSQNN